MRRVSFYLPRDLATLLGQYVPAYRCARLSRTHWAALRNHEAFWVAVAERHGHLSGVELHQVIPMATRWKAFARVLYHRHCEASERICCPLPFTQNFAHDAMSALMTPGSDDMFTMMGAELAQFARQFGPTTISIIDNDLDEIAALFTDVDTARYVREQLRLRRKADREEAERLARIRQDERYAACIQQQIAERAERRRAKLERRKMKRAAKRIAKWEASKTATHGL